MNRRVAALLPAYPLLVLMLSGATSAGAGYEIADTTQASENDYRGYTKVYLNDGTNPINEEEWATFIPPEGYLQNTPRNPEFNAENTLGSPGKPAGEVTIEEIGTDANNEPYTWKFIAQTQSAMWGNSVELPFPTNPYRSASVTATPPEGVIKFSSNEKNQEMIFWANDENGDPIKRYFITDQWGNRYIMGASGAPSDAELDTFFNNAVLPDGWTKDFGYLTEDLHLMPAYGRGNQAHFNLFRESGDNTYFQFEWSTSGVGVATQIAGMPIWGGPTSDTLLGRAGDDNVIHGAEGDDVIFALGLNDILYGDAGEDTVVFSGLLSDYTVLSYAAGGSELLLEGFGYQKLLYDVEWMRFEGDGSIISTAAVPEPSALWLLLGAGGLVWGWTRRGQGLTVGPSR